MNKHLTEDTATQIEIFINGKWSTFERGAVRLRGQVHQVWSAVDHHCVVWNTNGRKTRNYR